MTAGPDPSSSGEPIRIQWEDVVRFIRQLSHDLRNRLNAAELQSAYLAEVIKDPALLDEIRRLRQIVSEFGPALQKLSTNVAQVKPNLIPYAAADFVEDLQRKVSNDFPKEGAAVTWDIQLGEAKFEIDPQLLEQALLELFANAFRHQAADGTLNLSARIDGQQIVLTLREARESFDLPTENWGREPLRYINQGHYGLGLNRVRAILESHGGRLYAQHDKASATLVTTIDLPLGHQKS